VKIFVKFSTPLEPATNKKTEDERLLKLPLSAELQDKNSLSLKKAV